MHIIRLAGGRKLAFRMGKSPEPPQREESPKKYPLPLKPKGPAGPRKRMAGNRFQEAALKPGYPFKYECRDAPAPAARIRNPGAPAPSHGGKIAALKKREKTRSAEVFECWRSLAREGKLPEGFDDWEFFAKAPGQSPGSPRLF